MKQITIPFKARFGRSMAEGMKTRTWRTRRYGIPGDEFVHDGVRYQLVVVEESVMGSVPEYYREEGFADREDAIRTLEEIFPQNGYQPERMGWAHWFMRVPME